MRETREVVGYCFLHGAGDEGVGQGVEFYGFARRHGWGWLVVLFGLGGVGCGLVERVGGSGGLCGSGWFDGWLGWIGGLA